ncbi:DUF6895 family protein [Streptomyces composti]|uniref:DUF6895 family protein n=1 Tax=Streptomyces composti TaxID=2720025 RepID=UPI002811696B|nr:hypothetical protein [Streptomyces composti]
MTATGTREIREVAEHALAWTDAHLAAFALGEDALSADGEVDHSWKPLGELAQVCATVSHHTAPQDPLHTRAAAMLDFAWGQTGEGELFRHMQRLEPFATYPLEVYGAFASAGYRHRAYEEAAAVVARTRSWWLTEQEPTRRLAVLSAEERSGIRRAPVEELLPAGTWLAGRPEPWTFERDAGYAATHVVFHLTDWGRDPAGLPPALADYLHDWLPAWLDTCLEAGMWDLSCELLSVAATVPRLTGDPALGGAWERIRAAQRPTGALPELEHHSGDTEAAGADDDPHYFMNHYHSTLMAAFAAVLTTARPGGPAGEGTEGTGRKGPRHSGQGAPA